MSFSYFRSQKSFLILRKVRSFFSIIYILISFQLFGQDTKSDEKELKTTIDFLCEDELKGRLPGQNGYNKAANYCADKFREFGLLPLSDSGFFQYFYVETNQILNGSEFYSILDKKKINYKLGRDYIFRGFTGSANFPDKKTVFCGYGISRPDLGYDDYASIDVRDKVVIVFKQQPIWRINDQNWGSGSPREKAALAELNGAVGIIFVSSPNITSPQSAIGSVFHGEGIQNEKFPQLHMELAITPDFFSGTEFTLSELQSIIDSTKKPFSLELPTETGINVATNYLSEARTMNVVGFLEGSDPVLKNEYIVIGAHLDHVGSQGDEVIFRGANDNASGSAAVLEIARILSRRKEELKRTLIFVLFSAEEQGLNGSTFFVENSPVPHEQITAMFNFDCVGHGDSLQVGNGFSCPVLWSIVKNKDKSGRNVVIERTWSGGGADATAFHNVEIPSLYFASSYSYTHLHKLSDTPETINYMLLKSLVDLAIESIVEIGGKKYKKENIVK